MICVEQIGLPYFRETGAADQKLRISATIFVKNNWAQTLKYDKHIKKHFKPKKHMSFVHCHLQIDNVLFWGGVWFSMNEHISWICLLYNQA